MKKKIFLSIFNFILIFSIFSQVPPIWYENKSLQFPERDYISAVGRGFYEDSAKDDALETLSLYFESNVKVRRSSLLSGNESGGGVQKNRSFSSESSVESNAKLPAVSFTNSFYNEARKEFAVCAFIKKRDAIDEFNAKLSAGILRANSKVQNAQSTNNLFLALKITKETITQLEDLQKISQYLFVLGEENTNNTSESIDNLYNRCNKIIYSTKPKLTFNVKIQNDSDEIITHTIQELLESQGFSCKTMGYSYIITGNIKFSESENAVGVFVRPAISLQVFSADDKSNLLGSYSKQYPKYGHKNWNGAHEKARVEIEKDLKAKLLDSLF